MKKILFILLLMPALVWAQSDVTNQTAIDSLLTNIAKKNNASFLWRLYKGLNDSKLNKDSAAFNLITTGTTGAATYSGGVLTIPIYSVSTTLADTIISIGDWNMGSTMSINITHGLSDFKKIRSVSVIIRDDSDTFYYVLTSPIVDSFGDAGVHGAINQISSSVIVIRRSTTGFFDNANFNSTSYNRGYVRISYEL